jgi:hypothetical protein
MTRNLTPAQQKAKHYDEIACRIAFAIAGIAIIAVAISHLVR